jgi:hypothetical protein
VRGPDRVPGGDALIDGHVVACAADAEPDAQLVGADQVDPVADVARDVGGGGQARPVVVLGPAEIHQAGSDHRLTELPIRDAPRRRRRRDGETRAVGRLQLTADPGVLREVRRRVGLERVEVKAVEPAELVDDAAHAGYETGGGGTGVEPDPATRAADRQEDAAALRGTGVGDVGDEVARGPSRVARRVEGDRARFSPGYTGEQVDDVEGARQVAQPHGVRFPERPVTTHDLAGQWPRGCGGDLVGSEVDGTGLR